MAMIGFFFPQLHRFYLNTYFSQSLQDLKFILILGSEDRRVLLPDRCATTLSKSVKSCLKELVENRLDNKKLIEKKENDINSTLNTWKACNCMVLVCVNDHRCVNQEHQLRARPFYFSILIMCSLKHIKE
nr:hypothetical protein [Tanacetum cinerariifolium]